MNLLSDKHKFFFAMIPLFSNTATEAEYFTDQQLHVFPSFTLTSFSNNKLVYSSTGTTAELNSCI